MKTVLVSGCCGFIGQNLVSKLVENYNIIGIDNFFSSNRLVLKKSTELRVIIAILVGVIDPEDSKPAKAAMPPNDDWTPEKLLLNFDWEGARIAVVL